MGVAGDLAAAGVVAAGAALVGGLWTATPWLLGGCAGAASGSFPASSDCAAGGSLLGLERWQWLSLVAYALNIVSVSVPGRIDNRMAAETRKARETGASEEDAPGVPRDSRERPVPGAAALPPILRPTAAQQDTPKNTSWKQLAGRGCGRRGRETQTCRCRMLDLRSSSSSMCIRKSKIPPTKDPSIQFFIGIADAFAGCCGGDLAGRKSNKPTIDPTRAQLDGILGDPTPCLAEAPGMEPSVRI